MRPELRYDAQCEPDQDWFERDEQERQDAIVRYHERLDAEHPRLSNPALHALVHMILEGQLAMDEPDEVKPALKRLLSRGRTRHQALHQLGIPLTHYLFAVLQGADGLDAGLREYERVLREL